MQQVHESVTSLRARAARVMKNRPGIKRGLIEAAFLLVLYVAYSASRTLASNDFSAARDRAIDILDLERTYHIAFEGPLNILFTRLDWLGVFGSFWYASLHYIVTAAVLVWLYVRSPAEYVLARRALVLATIVGLSFYLLAPTAPPRLLDGTYVDVLRLHASDGWWGAEASAPKGLGNLTNQLAAFPSLHAGWALWVALVLIRSSVPKIVKQLGMAYAVTTALVVVGTANHWVLDAVVGWMIVLAAYAAVVAWEHRNPLAAHEELARAAATVAGATQSSHVPAR